MKASNRSFHTIQYSVPKAGSFTLFSSFSWFAHLNSFLNGNAHDSKVTSLKCKVVKSIAKHHIDPNQENNNSNQPLPTTATATAKCLNMLKEAREEGKERCAG